MVYRKSVSHFKVINTPLKDTDGKGKFKRMLSFLLVDKKSGVSLQNVHCPSFEEFKIHEIFIPADRSPWPVLKCKQAAKFF